MYISTLEGFQKLQVELHEILNDYIWPIIWGGGAFEIADIR